MRRGTIISDGSSVVTKLDSGGSDESSLVGHSEKEEAVDANYQEVDDGESDGEKAVADNKLKQGGDRQDDGGVNSRGKKKQERSPSSDGLSEQLKLLSLIDRIKGENEFVRYLKQPEYIKLYKKRKGVKQFRRLFLAQELRPPAEAPLSPMQSVSSVGGSSHSESGVSGASGMNKEQNKPIWVLKFSKDGKYMATGGKSNLLNIWKVISSPMERWCIDHSQNIDRSRTKTISILNNQLAKYRKVKQPLSGTGSIGANTNTQSHHGNGNEEISLYSPIFHPIPYRIFNEHTQDILDCDWSKNSFLLTASMDRTVKLWHSERKISLDTFQHPDFVTCVKFHPGDDRFFLSGCLDHNLRIWSILDNKTVHTYDCKDLITALDISPDGNLALVGTFNGYIHVLSTKGLELKHSFHLLNEACDSGDKQIKGPKVTGLEFFNSGESYDLKLLITSNDSRIRIYDMETMKMIEKLRGLDNKSSQICAHHVALDNDISLVLSASEDHCIYGWVLRSTDDKTKKSDSADSLSSAKSNRLLCKKKESVSSNGSSRKLKGLFRKASHGVETANKKSLYDHLIPHQNRDNYLKNSDYITFHAHHHPATTAQVAPLETLQILSLSNDIICELMTEFSQEDTDLDILISPKQTCRNSIRSWTDPHPEKVDKNRKLNKHLPMMKQSFGKIIVTTDTSGVIRVFRKDISKTVRMKVCNMLENVDLNAYSADRNLPADSISHSASSGTVNTNKNTPHSAANCISKLYRHENKSNTSMTSSLRRPRSITNGTTDDNLANSAAGTANSPKILCDICGGDLVTTANKNSFQDSKSRYCLECGNQLNRFR